MMIKKKLLIGALTFGLIATGVTVATAGTDKVKEDMAENALISIKDAEKIALKKVNGKIKSIELDDENGNPFYEIEVEQKDKEYEIYIDAYTGDIVHMNEDIEDDSEDVEMNQAIASNLISELQAIDIAESVMDGTVTEMELDKSNGQYVYEMELKTDNGQVEIEIDAITGEILRKEVKEKKIVQSSETKSFTEFQKISKLINVDDLKVQLVTDNSSKRIILFLDANGREKYKTIFIKSTNHLKLIEINGGLVFNGKI
ncbi:PepSY domain-containing protein [Ornithinibacillus bavariensis]|nr:PepSY domain-containing protein [Ornithinibacillus bavariensis]